MVKNQNNDVNSKKDNNKPFIKIPNNNIKEIFSQNENKNLIVKNNEITYNNNRNKINNNNFQQK